MAKIYVWCETVEEREMMLDEFERRGYTWASGCAPREFGNHICPIGYSISDHGAFCYSSMDGSQFQREQGATIMTPQEFCGSECKAKEVVKVQKETPTTEMLDALTNEGMDLLTSMEIYHEDRYVVRDIMKKAYENKTALRNVLRNHPKWNEEKQMVVFSANYDREFDQEAIYNFAWWLSENMQTYNRIVIGAPDIDEEKEVVEVLESWGYTLDDVYDHGVIIIYGAARKYCIDNGYRTDYTAREFLDKKETIKTALDANTILSFFKEIHTPFFNEDYDRWIERVNEIDDRFRLRNNMKASKAILKICRTLGWDKLGGTYTDHRTGAERKYFDQKYTELADAISPLTITRYTLISINPIDFWTMSFGDSWSSCHTINKEGVGDIGYNGDNYSGCYSSGTESYMLDETSLVFYTVDKTYDGIDFELQGKHNRCMFHIGEDKIVQGRVYPQGNDGATDLYRNIREIMQKVWADAANIPNLWKNVKGTSECGDVTSHIGTHYKDVLCYSDCNVSYHGEKNFKKIVIGHNPICPCCGKEHYNQEAIECEDCFDETAECACCGYRYDREDMIEIDGEYYCDECTFYCEYHGRREPGEPTWVENMQEYVCEDALYYSGDFERCDYCDEWIYTRGGDCIEAYDGKYFCDEDCAKRAGYIYTEEDWAWHPESDFVVCDGCGALYLEENTEEIDGKHYCEDCASDMEEANAA